MDVVHAMPTMPPKLHPQHGGATLIFTMLLAFTMMLVAGFVSRNLVLEHRMSVNQYRSTQAFEAAEAGLEWALAQLNNPQRLGSDCAPVADRVAISFRERYLSLSHSDSMLAPRTWIDAGVARALQPGCVRSAAGWSCSCPSHGLPEPGTIAAAAPFPAFSLQFMAGSKPGIVRVVATGCSSLAGPCQPGSTTRPDAIARLEVSLGLLGGVRVAPIAALTARGAVTIDATAAAASSGAHNTDTRTGIAIHSGADVDAGRLRVTMPAGAPVASGVIANDTALVALSADQFFVSYFGLDKARWQAQPVVKRIECSGDCGAALSQAIATASGSSLLWIDGDLELRGPITLGSREHPVVIVVNGSAQLRGAVAIHGVFYASSIEWNDAPSGGSVHGATISESTYRGNGAPDFYYDTQVLGSLNGFAGSFARVNGSWRDF